MSDKVEINDLVRSLTSVITAQNVHDKAYDGYQGYEWGYQGWEFKKAIDDASDDFAAKLDAYIDQRIEEKLKSV